MPKGSGVGDKAGIWERAFVQSTNEKQEGDLEHNQETFDEEMEGPLLETIVLARRVCLRL